LGFSISLKKKENPEISNSQKELEASEKFIQMLPFYSIPKLAFFTKKPKINF